MTDSKRILIADDHNIISKGLYYIITSNFSDFTISEVNSISNLSRCLSENDFTHLILDLNFDDGNALEVLPEIIKQYPNLFILIYSMASAAVFATKLLHYNISGFLSKSSSEEEIITALEVFLKGGVYINRHLIDKPEKDEDDVTENIFTSLSIGELKILGLLLKGKKSKEMAMELGVTQQTVATFKSRIFKKLKTENVFEIQRLSELHNINFS